MHHIKEIIEEHGPTIAKLLECDIEEAITLRMDPITGAQAKGMTAMQSLQLKCALSSLAKLMHMKMELKKHEMVKGLLDGSGEGLEHFMDKLRDAMPDMDDLAEAAGPVLGALMGHLADQKEGRFFPFERGASGRYSDDWQSGAPGKTGHARPGSNEGRFYYGNRSGVNGRANEGNRHDNGRGSHMENEGSSGNSESGRSGQDSQAGGSGSRSGNR